MTTVTSSEIIGYCDSITISAIEGWAYDRSDPQSPLKMLAFIDDTLVATVTCSLVRDDVQAGGFAARRVGFYMEIPLAYRDDREHTLQFKQTNGSPIFLQTNQGVKGIWFLPKAITHNRRRSETTIGAIDAIGDDGIFGWAYDRNDPSSPLPLQLLIDGTLITSCLCDAERHDVAAAGHVRAAVGFRLNIPSVYFDDEVHVAELRAISEPDAELDLPCSWLSQSFELKRFILIGQIDGLQAGAIRGWAYLHDRQTESKTTSLQIVVTMQGNTIAEVTARDLRPDVAVAHDCPPNCGFAFFPPLAIVAGKTVELSFTVRPGQYLVPGSPLTISFQPPEAAIAFHELTETADRLLTDIWLFRKRLREMMPEETYTVEHYDRWARIYRERLAASPDQLMQYRNHTATLPLVSIVCPVHKPRLSDLIAAVESVRQQSYNPWELIIVDDASQSVDISQYLMAVANEDQRIRCYPLATNSGISCATNTALAHARGKYVAFLDHDDLLESRALEYMVSWALRTNALVLYSDEDKIDDEGIYSEVNLKSDWNYRLLLSQNYICHLLLVERRQIDLAGPLNSLYDGAQDHDMMLRLTEITPPSLIVHVPEILYHWRKTPTSTAASGKTKAYAVNAGSSAIAAHLKRKGVKIQAVFSPTETTCYQINWRLDIEPTVTIIIPYREQISMTRSCVTKLQKHTNYSNYDIILVDNWSTSDEATAFADEMQRYENIAAIRIAEGFNFSRLNNVATKRSRSDFFLFMNNDVFVLQDDWLTVMVGEAVADPTVAIVGNKLLYPSKLIQHGGVILGVGGIADHAHKGLENVAAGFAARAISAQEFSAVTAACMLCRRTVFEELGGFDETELKVAFNDVDLCLRARAHGHRIIWTPASVAEHHESLSRGDDMVPTQRSRFIHENEIMTLRWSREIANDAFYHRLFSRNGGIFTNLADPKPFYGSSTPNQRAPL